MCGRFTSTSSVADLAREFEVDEVRVGPQQARYNVAPSEPVLAVATRRPRGDEERPLRQLGTFRWGLVPPWATDPAAGARMINARAESVDRRPAFRQALARRRCIIPADAFYEWQPRPGPGGLRGPKLPWAVVRRDGRCMAFAGLWEVWRDPASGNAAPLRTCAIITTEANAVVAPIHNRMPVVLPEEAWSIWLDPAIEDPALLTGLLVPAPADWFEAYPVSSQVNSVSNDGPELLVPAPPPAGPYPPAPVPVPVPARAPTGSGLPPPPRARLHARRRSRR